MIKPLLCILLGLLVTSIGLGMPAGMEEVSGSRALPTDTTRALRFDSVQGGRFSRSQTNPPFPWRAGPNTLADPSIGSVEGASEQGWAITRGRLRPGRQPLPTASGPVADPNLVGANGIVLDIARSGNTLYIAGAFRSVGENSGGFVPSDARTGEALRPFPKVAGLVNVIVPDGSGGWYIGGEFTGVGGKPRSCLAQVLADGSVSDWNPSVTGSPGYITPPAVGALAVRGNRVYVGGAFRAIGGLPRSRLGCVDARTGEVLDWNDTGPDTLGYVVGYVRALAIHENTVFVGGGFGEIGGQVRNSLAAMDAITGEVRPWLASMHGGVFALAVRADTLYAGGDFIGINFLNRPMLVALDVHTAELLPFDARPSGIYRDYVPQPQVAAMTLVGDTLYVAGNFTQIGGQPQSSVAALDVATGDALAWTAPGLGPQYDGFAPPLLETLAVAAGTVYVGGRFWTVGGESRSYAAALDRETGALSAWNPNPDYPVRALAVTGDTVYVGGEFSLVGEWQHRAGLAAIDLTTGALKPWNPNPDGSVVSSVEVGGGRVYVSGGFTNIGGVPRPRQFFAALDTINGEVLDWDPGADDVASALLLEGDTLYAGGYFTQIGGQPRNYLAALSVTTGEVMAWNPNADYPVLAMARSGNTMYVGGLFNRVGGQGRVGIAAVEATTGDLTPWNPASSGLIEAIVVSGNTVYVGGGFDQIGGQSRKAIAALDAATGAATRWSPDPTNWDVVNPRIRSLALADSVIFVGGSFSGIGGQPRICLAALDTATGLATDWDPGANGYVWSLAAEGATVYAGGGFTRAGGLPISGIAAFSASPPPPPDPPPTRLAISQIWPNPVRSRASLRLARPTAAPASLDVYDLQGRRIAAIFRDQAGAAGIQEVSFPTDGWPVGLYLCRLEAGGERASRKLLVVR